MEEGFPDLVEKDLKHPHASSFINNADISGYTALHEAAMHGQYSSLLLLLEARADTSRVVKKNSWTPLHGAARSAAASA